MAPPLLVLIVSLALAIGCGGKVDSGDGSGEPAAGGSTAGDSDAGSGGSSSGEQLGECKLGPKRNQDPNQACAWIAEGRCYSTKKAACNCVCPRDHDSLCISEFPEDEPSASVTVSCF